MKAATAIAAGKADGAWLSAARPAVELRAAERARRRGAPGPIPLSRKGLAIAEPTAVTHRCRSGAVEMVAAGPPCRP